MKCPNCFNEIDPKLSECPYCGNINLLTFELPVLKEEDLKGSFLDNDDSEPNITKVSFDEHNDIDVREEKEFIEENITDDANDSFDVDAGDSDEIVSFDKENNDDNGIFEKEDSSESNLSEENIVFTDDKEDSDSGIEDNVPSINNDSTSEIQDDTTDVNKSDEINIIQNSDDSVENEEVVADNEVNFEKTLSTRKKIVSFSLIGVALIFILCLCYFIKFQDEPEKTEASINDVEVILTEYHNENNDSKLEKLLEMATDEEKLETIQNKTKELLMKWINDDLGKEYDSELDFNSAVDNERVMLNAIYNYHLKNNSDSLLKKEDYSDLLNEIENAKKNNSRYFNALKLFNEDDYNESYKELSRISSTNVYYKKCQELKKKIVNEILDRLKNDLEKLKDANKEELLAIFQVYCENYDSVPLNTDDGYVALYNQYK